MGEKKELKKSFLRQKRWRVSLAVFVLLLVYTVSGFFLIPWILQSQMEGCGSKLLRRRVTLAQVKFNPYSLRLQVDGLKVDAAAGKNPLLKIDYLGLDIAGFLSLVNRALVLEQVDIKGPSFSAVKKRNLSYNFSDIVQALTAKSPEEEPDRVSEKSGLRFSLNNITLTGGLLEFDDQTTDTRHKISEIVITLPWISNLPQLIENDVEPFFAAVVNGTPFKANGKTKPFNRSLETHFAINLEKLDLPFYLSYLPGKRNFNLVSGTLTTRLDLVYIQQDNGRERLTLGGTATVNDFLVSGRDNEKDYRFITFPELVITLGSGNLLAGEFFIEDIVCRKPEIDFLHKPDGAFYLPMLIAAASRDEGLPVSEKGAQPDPGARKPEKKFVFKLARMRLQEGIFRVYDRRVSPAFSTRFFPVDISLENFSTAAGEAAQYSLKLQSDLGETLACSGSFTLDPLKVNTHFALQDLPLPEYVTYYKNYFAGRFSAGQLGLQGDVAVAKSSDGAVQMNLQGFECELDDCKLSTPDGALLLDLPRFKLSQSEIDFDKHECVLGELAVEKGKLNLIRQKSGGLNLQNLLPPPVASGSSSSERSKVQDAATEPDAASVAEEAADKPWHIRMRKGNLRGFSVAFKDLVPAAETLVRVEKINLSLEQVGTASGESGSLQLDLHLSDKGSLAVAGTVGVSPLKVDLDIDLQKLSLPNFQNYLAEYLDLSLIRGRAAAAIHLSLGGDSETEKKALVSGDVFFDDLQTVDNDRARDLLGWRRLKLSGLSYSLEPYALSFEQIFLDGVRVNFEKDSDGRTNFEKALAVEKSAAKPAPDIAGGSVADEQKQAIPALNIKEVKIASGALLFSDHSLTPSVEMTLDDFAGSVVGLTSLNEKPAEVDFKGKLNRQSQVSISGEVNPLADNLYVDLQIKGDGVGLTALSPYCGKYVGYAVKKGKVSLNLKYKVDAQKLVAKNSIFIDQFAFGSTVDSPDSMDLPVKMAVALLRNRQGEIDLELPVSGDLSDPQFSIGAIIVKVFINLITKAVTSPFSLIGSLAGGSEGDLNLVSFVAGQAGLDAEAKQRLEKLAKVLYERPGLKVEIAGSAVAPGDRVTLQNEHFMRLLKLQKLKDQAGERSEQNLAGIVMEKAEFEKYLWRAYKAAPIEKEKLMLGLVKKIEPAEQERLLREFVKVDDDELRALATRRARAVMDFLREKGPIEAQRLFLLSPQIISAELDEKMKNQVEIKIK